METGKRAMSLAHAHKNTEGRKRLLAVLFVKAEAHGIDADKLRDVIAPAMLGKRLSEASAREIVQLLDHVTKLYKSAPALPRKKEREAKHYEPSRAGLIEELEDAACARWGADFEKSLNAFVNSRAIKAVTHYRFLGVTALKGLKNRIKDLNRKGVR